MQRDDEFDGVPHPAGGEAPNVVPIDRGRRKQRRLSTPSERTELQLAELLIERFGDRLRYCAQRGGWHAWTGTHWARDLMESARECAKTIARELADEAAALLDDKTFRSARRAGSAGGVSAILDLARSTPGIVFAPDQADRDPWALNCLSGTLDLRTGVLRPHDRAEIITRVCGVAPPWRTGLTA